MKYSPIFLQTELLAIWLTCDHLLNPHTGHWSCSWHVPSASSPIYRRFSSVPFHAHLKRHRIWSRIIIQFIFYIRLTQTIHPHLWKVKTVWRSLSHNSPMLHICRHDEVSRLPDFSGLQKYFIMFITHIRTRRCTHNIVHRRIGSPA
jgi:hypothetical protein